MNGAPRCIVFLSAAALLGVVALAPPLDRLADRSFAWHMLQHMLLLYPIALLLLGARPFELFAALAAKRTVAQTVRATRPLAILASPWVALSFFVAVLWVTHFSPLYELSLQRAWVHAAEHALYLAAGIAFWIPVMAPPPLRPLSYPARLLYLVVVLPQGALLGMALFAAPSPLYAHYAAAASSRFAALTDQHDAAALMWIAGGLTALTALLVTLGIWAHRESDRRLAAPR